MSRILSSAILLLLIAAVAWQVDLMDKPLQAAQAAGLEVYLGEGCIHCHSQYRRPVGRDMELWGSATNAEQALSTQHPVLFGNRRQGPDLSNVGLRRSREWNRAHLMDPRTVRPGSRMPSYAYLFKAGDSRGEALLDYLQELGIDESEEWQAHVADWSPVAGLPEGNLANGEQLYRQVCSACHGTSGDGTGSIAGAFTVSPRNLQLPAEWQWVKSDMPDRDVELARLIKYGRPGTSMAGTEWLGGQELADLIRFLKTLQQDETR
jgi:cytochrome c oxidase cbb3-type subunit 2